MNDLEGLANFLLARYGEDEAVARLCAAMFPPPWEIADRGWRVRIYSADVPDVGEHAEPGDVRSPVVMEVEPSQRYDDPLWLSERVEHVRRHDPARVLADCKVKRKIVEACRVAQEDSWAGGRINDPTRALAEEVLTALAQTYADHKQFREEWQE